MNDRSDVATLQPFLGDWRCQDDAVVFSNHDKLSLLARIRRHQARRFHASVDDPDGSYRPAVAAFSLQPEQTVDNMFLAVERLAAVDDFAGPSHRAEGGNQRLRGIASQTSSAPKDRRDRTFIPLEFHERARMPTRVCAGGRDMESLGDAAWRGLGVFCPRNPLDGREFAD